MWLIFAILAAGAFLAHTAPFPFVLEAFRPGRSLWRVAQPRGAPPTVYLTFDDGPNAEWTPAVLDLLRAERVHATFFLIDDHVSPDTEPVVRRIADEGHAIGLHTGTRKPVIQSPDEVEQRIRRAARHIESITGREPCRLFRPHAGWRSATMYEGIERAGYRLTGWSWGMWDWHWWQKPDAGRTARRLARKASAGDIIVIHDGDNADPHADRRSAPETLRLLIPALRARGFSFAALCDSSGEAAEAWRDLRVPPHGRARINRAA